MALVRGVDGCRAGWLGVTLDLASGAITSRVFADAAGLLGDDSAEVTAIDIPIGLPSDRRRACDVEARRILGPRRNSVFWTPIRPILGAATHREASDTSKKMCGDGVSQQAFRIMPKIREVDAALRRTPALQARVFEVHPEVCFRAMNGEVPLERSKRSGFGFLERLQLIEAEFPGSAGQIRRSVAPKEAADDDILDALAALWTARRILHHEAIRLPRAGEERDAHGLPMQMLA